MSFPRIETSDLTNKGVLGMPDEPGLSYTAMQEKFDELSRDVIVPKFNALSDQLTATMEPNVITVPTTAWISNTHATYKKKAVIETTDYSADFIPISVDMIPSDGTAFFSDAENEAMEIVNPNVEFSATAVTFYATDIPSTSLKFRIRGEA